MTVAVAPNKLVAKIACTLAKPDGLRIVAAHEVRALLDPLPFASAVGHRSGSGPKTRAARAENAWRIGELRSESAHARTGRSRGELQALAAGQDTRPVVSERAAKSIGEESTFEVNISDRERVSAALTAHADEVARRLRRSGSVGHTITLKIKLGQSRTRRAARIPGEDGG